MFFRILCSWLSFYLQRNSSSVSLYVFSSSNNLFLKNHYALQFSWLLNMCSRETLLTSLNYSIVFSQFFFIIYPQYFFSLRAPDSVHQVNLYLYHMSLVNLKLILVNVLPYWWSIPNLWRKSSNDKEIICRTHKKQSTPCWYYYHHTPKKYLKIHMMSSTHIITPNSKTTTQLHTKKPPTSL